MKFHVCNSRESYEQTVESGKVMPGDRILITVPGRGIYTEVGRIPNDGSTRQQRRALKRENVELGCAVQGVNRKKRRALGRKAAQQLGMGPMPGPNEVGFA